MKTPDLVFVTEDHPGAHGREPAHGEVGYEIDFPLDDGRTLRIKMGEGGVQAMREIFQALDADNALDQVLAEDD